jgi:hypothetical protein
MSFVRSLVGLAALSFVLATPAWAQSVRFSVEERADAPSAAEFETAPYEASDQSAVGAVSIIQVQAAPEQRRRLLTVRNMHQKDEAYKHLNGGVMLCGAAAISNALFYLRYHHQPTFSLLAKDVIPGDWNDHLMVTDAYDRCDVSMYSGVAAGRLRRCGTDYLMAGGYRPDLSWAIGSFSEVSALQYVPQPQQLRALVDHGAAVVLLVGWFAIDGDVYVRHHGHFVMLAGYDLDDPTRFYVSNPLVNYSAIGSAENVSAIVLEQVNPRYSFANERVAQAINLGDRPVWQTRDLLDSRIGVIQGAIILGQPQLGLPN